MKASRWMAAVLLCGSTVMWAQPREAPATKDDLFAGTEKFAANASSVTEVDMDPDSLDMVGGRNSTRARRTVLSVVHTYTYDKPGMYNMADVDAFRNKLNTGDWHCSVHVRELKSGESTDVCRKHRTDDLEESAIITVEPKELTFIHTIRRPSSSGTPGKPGSSGGGDNWMSFEFEYGMPLRDGLPSSAWTAEMRAHAAEMRAQSAIQRAEMASLRPEMLENMALMRADMAGQMPGLRMEMLMPGSFWTDGYPTVDLHRLQDLSRHLNEPFILRKAPSAPPTPPKTPKTTDGAAQDGKKN